MNSENFKELPDCELIKVLAEKPIKDTTSILTFLADWMTSASA
uniref:Uncharacterized protein n=1 Tax=Candidatus Methanogaster sp. ANME-2c ERB4 TaxID=2759911 RepID=A0A7G9YQ43_9EURY|nr:hypothetical protein DMFPCFDI_00018 [Methanosarcinales archaeon ANME-2c ERB4]QNO50127.1 hypothetical protein GDOAKEED_00031 [Methanosarcinales archaeon ANME-2c ERB4]